MILHPCSSQNASRSQKCYALAFIPSKLVAITHKPIQFAIISTFSPLLINFSFREKNEGRTDTLTKMIS